MPLKQRINPSRSWLARSAPSSFFSATRAETRAISRNKNDHRGSDCSHSGINGSRLLHSETNDMNAGLVVEVWCKGFWWDRSLGYYYLPLSEVPYMNEVTRNQCNLNRTELPHRQSDRHTTSPDMRDTNSNTQQAITTDTVHQPVMFADRATRFSPCSPVPPSDDGEIRDSATSIARDSRTLLPFAFTPRSKGAARPAVPRTQRSAAESARRIPHPCRRPQSLPPPVVYLLGEQRATAHRSIIIAGRFPAVRSGPNDLPTGVHTNDDRHRSPSSGDDETLRDSFMGDPPPRNTRGPVTFVIDLAPYSEAHAIYRVPLPHASSLSLSRPYTHETASTISARN